MSLYYERIASLSSIAAVSKAVQFAGGPENMRGHRYSCGFLFLYELFTRTVKCRLAGGNSHTYSMLMLQLIEDKHSGGLMGSILHILSQNPDICQELALRYKDTRQTKSCEMRTVPTMHEKAVPLHDLFVNVVKLFKEKDLAGKLNWPPERETFPKLANPPANLRVYVTERNDMLSAPKSELPACLLLDHSPDCQITNFACDAQPVALGPINSAALYTTASEIAALEREDKESLAAFCDKPLSVLGLEQYLVSEAMAASPAQLPFRADDHPHAQSPIAKTTLKRMKEHMSTFSAVQSKRRVTKLKCIAQITASGSSGDVASARSTLLKLQGSLLQLRNLSVGYVKAAIPIITNAANHVELSAPSAAVPKNPAEQIQRLKYSLMLKSHNRTQLWFQYICCSLLSVRQHQEWLKLNPFVSKDTYDVAIQLLVRTLFHAVRVGQVNRCLEDISGLLSLLDKADGGNSSSSSNNNNSNNSNKRNTIVVESESFGFEEEPESGSGGSSPTKAAAAIDSHLIVELEQKADSLIRNLTAARAYVDAKTKCIDPRFLIFEFQANVILRDRQVDLVRKFVSAVKNDRRDIVEQMIMVSRV